MNQLKKETDQILNEVLDHLTNDETKVIFVLSSIFSEEDMHQIFNIVFINSFKRVQTKNLKELIIKCWNDDSFLSKKLFCKLLSIFENRVNLIEYNQFLEIL